MCALASMGNSIRDVVSNPLGSLSVFACCKIENMQNFKCVCYIKAGNYLVFIFVMMVICTGSKHLI